MVILQSYLMNIHSLMISKNPNGENGSDSDKNHNNINNHNNFSQTLTPLGDASGGNHSVKSSIDTTTELKDRGRIISDNGDDNFGKADIDHSMLNPIALVTVPIEYASLSTMNKLKYIKVLSLIENSWFWDEFNYFVRRRRTNIAIFN